jgi:hypothetical protein
LSFAWTHVPASTPKKRGRSKQKADALKQLEQDMNAALLAPKDNE